MKFQRDICNYPGLSEICDTAEHSTLLNETNEGHLGDLTCDVDLPVITGPRQAGRKTPKTSRSTAGRYNFCHVDKSKLVDQQQFFTTFVMLTTVHQWTKSSSLQHLSC